MEGAQLEERLWVTGLGFQGQRACLWLWKFQQGCICKGELHDITFRHLCIAWVTRVNRLLTCIQCRETICMPILMRQQRGSAFVWLWHFVRERIVCKKLISYNRSCPAIQCISETSEQGVSYNSHLYEGGMVTLIRLQRECACLMPWQFQQGFLCEHIIAAFRPINTSRLISARL